MEMQEVTMEGEKKEEDVGASEPMVVEKEVKTEEEEETSHYSKLESPPEDVYSEAYYGGPPVKTKAGKQSQGNKQGNTRLYRAACIFLTIICLVLLLVIIILSVKLQTGSTVCSHAGEMIAPKLTPAAPTCSQEQCQALFLNIQQQHRNCQQCADGWLTFGQSCFFMSTYRLSWDESQRNCSARGGSLAIINSQSVQSFLTKEGKMTYWIGLKKNSDTWTWVNNTALRESYWAGVKTQGECGILSTENPPEKNWITASCQAYTYFICQLQM